MTCCLYLFVVRHHELSISGCGQAIWLSIPPGALRNLLLIRYLQNPTVRDVHDVEIALIVCHRALKKNIREGADAAVPLGRLACASQVIWNANVEFSSDCRRYGIEIHCSVSK